MNTWIILAIAGGSLLFVLWWTLILLRIQQSTEHVELMLKRREVERERGRTSEVRSESPE